MTIKNISEVKAHLSAILVSVLKGEEVLIGKAGVPIAKIVPYIGASKPRKPGALKGKIHISEDFNDLPEDIAKSFGVS